MGSRGEGSVPKSPKEVGGADWRWRWRERFPQAPRSHAPGERAERRPPAPEWVPGAQTCRVLPHRGAGARLTAARCANAPRAPRPVSGASPRPFLSVGGRGAEPALEKLWASQRLGLCLCLLKTSREPAGATEGLGWARRSAAPSRGRGLRRAFHCAFPSFGARGKENEAVSEPRWAGEAGRAPREAGVRAVSRAAPRLLSLAPLSTPSPEGSWLLLLQVRQEKPEGAPGGERGEGGEAAAARGASVWTRRAAPRRGWAPSGLCPASRTPGPAARSACAALPSRAAGVRPPAGPRARVPAPRPPAPAPLPGRAEGPAGRGRRRRARGRVGERGAPRWLLAGL